ncbi:MAG: enoyl-CoA hydratase/isomerase family protein [Frankiaceae bacterium]|jgi:enoyl-CoA hydratase/carnithine racemase|nr:enoyl-CoA hydratase/isomerase family protein [Frankiaceae bacterium]
MGSAGAGDSAGAAAAGQGGAGPGGAGPGEPSEVLLRADHGAVRLLTLNRPHRRNALNRLLTRRLGEELAEADADPAVRAVVVTGAGTAFCAGVDLKESAEAGAGRFRPTASTHRAFFEVMLQMQTPIVAAMNGHAVGGGLDLALACDLRIGAAESRIGFPEALRGMGAAFATVLLPRLIPQAIALHMLYTGEEIDARRAVEIGLLNDVAPAGEVLGVALSLAGRIAANAPLTIRRMRANVYGTSGVPLATALQLDLGPDPYNSEDRLEGARAFAERRAPRWQGR